MDFEPTPLIETAMTTGTVGGGSVVGGTGAVAPGAVGGNLFWQVALDSKKRWTKNGKLRVKPRQTTRSRAQDERDRQKFLKQFSLLSLYRREDGQLSEIVSSRPSSSQNYPLAGLDHVTEPNVRGYHRNPMPGDPETSVLPITNKGNTKPEDMFLTDKEKRGSHLTKRTASESFLDNLPHKDKDIEDLDDEDWKDIQAVQNKTTSDPFWVWKRRLRYAGASKDYKEGKLDFSASPLV